MNRFVKNVAKLACTTTLIVCAASAYAATPNTTPNPAANAVDVSPAERAKIEAVVHQYLVSKPEVLVEAMQALQQKQYEQAEKDVKKTQQMASSFANDLFHQPADPVSGNAKGNVTVVEFFDYQCPHCIDMVPVIDGIIKANPNVRIVYKDFPIRGPMSQLAARAALAANLQGKYAVLSHAILTSNQPITEDLIMKLAKDNGIDVAKLKKDMASSSIDSQLSANLKLAQQLKLFGTPAIFIGKTDAKASDTIIYVPGQMQQKQLQGAIDTASK